MDTIGKRAHQEIVHRAHQNGVAPYREAQRIGINYHAFGEWKKDANPSAYYLARMLKYGYDIIYILSGERVVGEEK